MEQKKGIAVAGTVIVDRINEISAYPKSGELTQIKRIQKALGVFALKGYVGDELAAECEVKCVLGEKDK